MGRVLPILFNTNMVRAILDGGKTVTRRLIKPQPTYSQRDGFSWKGVAYGTDGPQTIKAASYNFRHAAPYRTGDILYVRETFCPNYFDESLAGYRGDGLRGNRNAYRADYNKEILSDVVPEPKWKPSIHMPKEASRIWLKVMNVQMERLQEITEEQAEKEIFADLWNSTLKKDDVASYGWDANPWVWVIEFERCNKPEGEL